MIQLPKEFDSVFRYIVVVSQRAEQIIKGAKPRTDSRRAKPTLIARDDVEGGQVGWRVLTQEELDAHRQALVEQFRAEMEAANERDLRQAIPDVLPTASVEEIADEDEDRDDELLRLQKLLGMSRGGKREVADEDLAADEDEDADEEIDLDDDFNAEEEG
jgi:DNA-directed RNA polymerase subunit K/omega